MDKFFGISFEPLLAIFLSACGIYIVTIVLTRISGKRSFSKMSSFDFAMTIAIGSVIGSTLLLASVNLINGIVGLVSIYALQHLIAFFRRYDSFDSLITNQPLLLMDGPLILEENLKKAHVTIGDLRAKLREANVIQLSQVKAVVFETTGDISVLHSNDEDKSLESWLLEEVSRH